jgi:hypothetical protein
MRVWALQLLLPVLGRAFLLPLAHPGEPRPGLLNVHQISGCGSLKEFLWPVSTASVDTASTVAARRSGAVSMSAQECSTRDLLIVGAGTLGYVCFPSPVKLTSAEVDCGHADCRQYVGKIYKEMHGDEAQVRWGLM